MVGLPDMTGLVAPAPAAESDGLTLTDPLTQPDLPSAPDPLKEELNAPMQAAGPVAGSIGSAVSVGQDGKAVDANGQPIEDSDKFGPNAGGAVPNVAFNDPATQAADAQEQPKSTKSKMKKEIKFNFSFIKNMNRNVLVALIVVAAMIIIALIAVLVMQLLK